MTTASEKITEVCNGTYFVNTPCHRQGFLFMPDKHAGYKLIKSHDTSIRTIDYIWITCIRAAVRIIGEGSETVPR